MFVQGSGLSRIASLRMYLECAGRKLNSPTKYAKAWLKHQSLALLVGVGHVGIINKQPPADQQKSDWQKVVFDS